VTTLPGNEKLNIIYEPLFEPKVNSSLVTITKKEAE
jgi:hypothetical protein